MTTFREELEALIEKHRTKALAAGDGKWTLPNLMHALLLNIDSPRKAEHED